MYLFNGKYTREGGNAYNNLGDTTIIYRGIVESVEDKDDAGRITVRILGVDNDDNGEPSKEIFPAFPMIPKHINIVPKKGEGVLIFTFTTGKNKVDRMYMGPITPQPQDLYHADYELKAWNGFSFGNDLGPAPLDRRKITGGFPKKEDIALQGRKNADLILKDDEVLLRAGKFVFMGDNGDNSKSDDEMDTAFKPSFKFNARTPGYIQIKYNTKIKSDLSPTTTDESEYGTVTNIVANKINLLTHKEGSPQFKLTNQENLISDDEMAKILTEAHQLVFGDKLIEFLNTVKAAITNHTHKYPGMTPHAAGSSEYAKVIQDMNQYDLEQILSKNIRIN